MLLDGANQFSPTICYFQSMNEEFFRKAKNRSVINSNVCQCCLLTAFANCLDPDQAQQNVGPDQDPNCLTLCDGKFRDHIRENWEGHKGLE